MTAKRKLAAFGVIFLLISSVSMALFSRSFENVLRPRIPIRVACVGDSITEGSGYTVKLQHLLGSGYVVGNFGVSGSAVLSNSDKPYANQSAFRGAKMFLPNIVVIMLGTNDASGTSSKYMDRFVDNYKRLVEEFQALRSQPNVLLVEPPPILENDLNLSDTHLVQGVIPGIQQVSDELNLPTIDLHTALADFDEYFGDGVHPSIEGAQLIASQINDAINSNSTY